MRLQLAIGHLGIFAAALALGTASATATVTVPNAAPTIEMISLPKPKLPDLAAPDLPAEIEEHPLRLEIRLSQRRVVLYRGDTVFKTYPVAVGRPGWETPTGSFKVMQKFKNPTWVHPLNGSVIPAGDPENPLGRYWIGFWTDGKNWVGFHGTPNPQSVGTAASHGCIRMYNKDIEELFPLISLGTAVIVTH